MRWHPILVAVSGLAVTAAVMSGCQESRPRRTRVLSAGHVSLDGLVDNGLFQDLGAVALSGAGLAAIPYIHDLVADAGGQTILKYIVSCALPADAKVTIDGV